VIQVRPAARDALLHLDKPTRRRLQRAIDGLPGERPEAAVPLTGQPGVFRIRVGGHQVLYAETEHKVETEHKEVLILVVEEATDITRPRGQADS
jgi:mRNA-degrading endonuclease RelE of RelBE toxin-antitoxin system